jgi:two-component system, sensor histidine kinase and response regulator
MQKAVKPFKILVVDDNTRNIQVIGTILREARYEVGFALDGKQAIDLLNDSGNYDLVLMDIRMPVMDGYEACSIMKKDERLKEIPVIFISASHETDNIISAFDTGGVDYVTKPFNAKELLARVNTHIELRQRTLEVKNYVIELEKLNATKDKFFSIIAHDLRNPFEGILMITRNLLSKLPAGSSDEVIVQLRMLESVADSGNKLLENLLIWSRAQTGSIAFNPGEIILESLVNRCIDSISTQAEAKNIRINYTSSGEIKVYTDEAMFLHVLRNLLTNAVKFTPRDGSVNILAEKSLKGVEVSVIDTGIGISKDDIDRLFKIDGNICSRTGTQNEAGSGLGLILCGEFVEKMGGAICAESEPGKGSRFTFTLPA